MSPALKQGRRSISSKVLAKRQSPPCGAPRVLPDDVGVAVDPGVLERGADPNQAGVLRDDLEGLTEYVQKARDGKFRRRLDP